MIGGYSALGGHLEVLVQPFEFVIICGASLGIFIVANPFATIKDCGKAFAGGDHRQGAEAARLPRRAERAARADARTARQVAQRGRSRISTTRRNRKSSRRFPKLLANADLVTFICDYCRLIIIGNAKTHEIEALMDEEIETLDARKAQARSRLIRRSPTACRRSASSRRCSASFTPWARSTNRRKCSAA